MDPRAFVEAHLPAAPARVLEVGCGDGRLARAIAANGFDVLAIDPNAPAGDIFRAVSLEDFTDAEGFDRVVAIRSLHHIADLTGAVAQLAQLVRPGGRILVHEHAWERLDAQTARWYLGQRTATGESLTLAQCTRDWNQAHHHLHTSAALLAALDRRFKLRFVAWAPYLHDEFGDAVTAEQEQAQIDAGAIQATGFYYVGEPMPTVASD